MVRVVVASLALALAATPSFACSWTQTSSTGAQSTTAAAQPSSPSPCPTCVTPDQGATQSHATAGQQQPS